VISLRRRTAWGRKPTSSVTAAANLGRRAGQRRYKPFRERGVIAVRAMERGSCAGGRRNAPVDGRRSVLTAGLMPCLSLHDVLGIMRNSSFLGLRVGAREVVRGILPEPGAALMPFTRACVYGILRAAQETESRRIRGLRLRYESAVFCVMRPARGSGPEWHMGGVARRGRDELNQSMVTAMEQKYLER